MPFEVINEGLQVVPDGPGGPFRAYVTVARCTQCGGEAKHYVDQALIRELKYPASEFIKTEWAAFLKKVSEEHRC
jgi:hypothetical protein